MKKRITVKHYEKMGYDVSGKTGEVLKQMLEVMPMYIIGGDAAPSKKTSKKTSDKKTK